MDTASPKTRSWHYWLLIAVLVMAFGWFAICASLMCRCYESIWHEAQAKAGLVFVGMVFLRMVVGAVFRERRFRWEIYLIMSLLSPLWIRLVFELVLRIHDAIAA
jgi:hypothetical protein